MESLRPMILIKIVPFLMAEWVILTNWTPLAFIYFQPLGWWFAIRIGWPNAPYPSPESLVQKMIRLHRPMQLGIDNSVAAAGIWRNLLMGSRAERSLDLERLRDLINTEVKNLRQRKQLGKLSIAVRPNWDQLAAWDEGLGSYLSWSPLPLASYGTFGVDTTSNGLIKLIPSSFFVFCGQVFFMISWTGLFCFLLLRILLYCSRLVE